ncbi:hypothetical protein niasHT_002488 [Heterodera trifolii]|uniref:DNA-directed DNA polymerase n=1 Tax=Heterodera trifolii TaxID=157864 RepID=A0ABD2LME7_9BILA
MSTSGGSSNEFPFGTSQAFGQETKMFLSGKDDEFPISAIDRKLWQGKTTVKISDLEKAQNDVAKLEDGVNRAVRHMNRSLNQKVNWVNDVVANTNANFETLKVQFVTLTERVDILEQDNDGTNSGGTVSITNQNRASLAPFVTPMGNAQPNQVVPNQVPIHQLSSEDEDDGPTLFGLNMLSSGPTVGSGLEMFCEESVFAFDDWAERFKDYLSVSGKVYTEQEKITRLKLALRDTPRALFKELLPAQTDTLDSALSELRQKLDSPQRREIAKRTLSLCKQREDETVAQFLRRSTPLVDATNSSLTGDIRKEKICEEFLDRLKPNISFLIRLVGLSRAKDLDLVRAQAEELEALLLMNKGDEASRLSQAVNTLSNQSSQSQWSTEANQNNDRAGQWSSRNNVRGFRPFSGSNATRQQQRGRGGRGRSRNWGGGRQEQFSQRNWSSNPRCHYCDRAEHFAYNCHQRRANFRGNSNQSFRQGRWSNQQPRQSQGQWQNRQNPVNIIDAPNSSNTSPGFFENLAQSLLDLKIQDNRNYKNEEPRSGAMNALTHIKPKTTAMDCQIENELAKGSSSESPACGPETKIYAPKTSNWERPSVRSKVASLMFITLMLFGMTLPFTAANLPHLPMHPLVCQTQNGGKIWQLPAVTGCSKLSIDHSKAPVVRTFDIFSPNLFEHSAEAWACRKVRKSVRKYTSITNVPIQETLEPLLLEMTLSECKQMAENGKCSLGLLINDSGLLPLSIGSTKRCTPWWSYRALQTSSLGNPRVLTREVLLQPPTTPLPWTCSSNNTFRGLLLVRVLAPRLIRVPLLGYRTKDGRFTFPLCAWCADRRQQRPCQHDNYKRSWVCAYTHVELNKALQLGYIVVDLFEVWNYDEWDDDLFSKYVNTFVGLKVQATGWPEGCETDEQRKEFVDNFMRTEGIQLDSTKMTPNPGLRLIAKTLANSLWGKMAQRVGFTQIKYTRTPAEFHQLLEDPTFDKLDFVHVSEHMDRVVVRKRPEFAKAPLTNCLPVAIYVTSYARLHLYSYMEKVIALEGAELLYCDTDSIYYVNKMGGRCVPEGEALGQMKREHTDRRIVEFVAGGPKNYGIRHTTRDGNDERANLKIRSFRLSYATQQLLNFEAMKDLTLATYNIDGPIDDVIDNDDLYVYGGGAHRSIRVTFPQIDRNVRSDVYTCEAHKDYRPFYAKGRVRPGMQTRPFGYVKDVSHPPMQPTAERRKRTLIDPDPTQPGYSGWF